MSLFKQALLQAQQKGTVDKLPKVVAEMALRPVEEQKKADSLQRNRLRASRYRGLGDLNPCSFLAWKPGTAVKLTSGKYGRIAWGLSDGGNEEKVVVLLDGLSGSKLELHSLIQVFPCDCKGYRHSKSCLPKARK